MPLAEIRQFGSTGPRHKPESGVADVAVAIAEVFGNRNRGCRVGVRSAITAGYTTSIAAKLSKTRPLIVAKHGLKQGNLEIIHLVRIKRIGANFDPSSYGSY
tara:strand:- start:15 stop:320 length:306 start_codon:yes stop_codon:yes gene_type:complete